MKEKRKPIEIVCPHCGKTTTIICRETRSGWDEGVLYDLDCDFETTTIHDYYIGWDYRCSACNTDIDSEDIEELMDAADPIPLHEQLMMESGIDIFEEFWVNDKD